MSLPADSFSAFRARVSPCVPPAHRLLFFGSCAIRAARAVQEALTGGPPQVLRCRVGGDGGRAFSWKPFLYVGGVLGVLCIPSRGTLELCVLNLLGPLCIPAPSYVRIPWRARLATGVSEFLLLNARSLVPSIHGSRRPL